MSEYGAADGAKLIYIVGENFNAVCHYTGELRELAFYTVIGAL